MKQVAKKKVLKSKSLKLKVKSLETKTAPLGPDDGHDAAGVPVIGFS